jgi:hypothetical protein
VILASVATRDEKNPLVDVALDATRLVVEALTIVALVVVELPTKRSEIDARVATRDEMKELVEVLFATTSLVTERFVVVALLLLKLVVKKLVEELLVITEEEAKIFCAKRLRNLLRLVPRVYVASRLGTTS